MHWIPSAGFGRYSRRIMEKLLWRIYRTGYLRDLRGTVATRLFIAMIMTMDSTVTKITLEWYFSGRFGLGCADNLVAINV